jgi:hypothetical protein
MPEIQEEQQARPSAEAEEVYLRWLQHLDEQFTRHHKPAMRAELVRDQLHQLLLGRPHGGKLNFTLTSELPFNVLQLTFDPANVTLKAQNLPDLDHEQYASRQPLIWFWHMFDRSPAALNYWLGTRFRAILGKYIFKHIGQNVRISHGVNFTFGYNLSIEDDCVVRRRAVLDDRQELILRKGANIGEYASIYTHDSGAAQDRGSRTFEVVAGAVLPPHWIFQPGIDGEGKVQVR